MANAWFRLYAEFASDPKVQMLSEVDQRRLIMLFCNRCNVSETLHETEVMFQLRISSEEWQKTKANFIAKGFINEANEVLNWDKRQYTSDSSTERVIRHREKKKIERNNVKRFKTVTVTPPEQNRTEHKYIPPIPANLLNDFLKVRKAKRVGELTETAFKGIERESIKAGISPAEAIEICCKRGWASFSADWDCGIKKKGGLRL